MVIMLSVKPMYQMSANVAIIDVGCDRRDIRRSEVHRNNMTTKARAASRR